MARGFRNLLIDVGRDETMWSVWNSKYGRTDSGDMGFITLRNAEYEAHSRGDIPRNLGTFDNLDDALRALIEAY